MSLGLTPRGGGLWGGTGFVADRVEQDSIFVVLNRDGDRLFPDESFADLFSSMGRKCIPPRVVFTVMVLQRYFGLSDREAVDAFEFDMRWKFACELDMEYPGFVHTVLVTTRNRLALSEDPDRIFKATVTAARAAGLVKLQAGVGFGSDLRRGGHSGHRHDVAPAGTPAVAGRGPCVGASGCAPGLTGRGGVRPGW